MRIAVNSRLLVPGKTDGIARFTLETFKRITAAHPEVEFTFIYDREQSSFDFGENCKSISLFPPARHPILWYIWFEYSLKRFLNKGHFDLFISPEGWVPGNLKMPSLAVIHDLNFLHLPEHVAPSHRKFLQHFFPKYAQRANRIATVSEFSKQDIVQSFQIVANKIDVVYNGVNKVFKPCSEERKFEVKKEYTNGEEYFIFVGTLHPRKNLNHLFLAFDSFKKKSNSNLKLLVVGNKKWWPKELEDIYKALMHKNDILFVGRVEDEELSDLLAASLALTYIPHFEGFGIPILEAFQCQTAVITSTNTSLPEVAQNAALLCDSNNANEIAEAMLKIAENSSLRIDLIEKGSQRAKDFSWDLSAQKLWNSVEKCLGFHGA